MDSLKTCFFGGYDKLDTLKYIDHNQRDLYAGVGYRKEKER